MLYRVTASLERLDEEQCSIVIEQIENAFRKARVRGKIFISIDKEDSKEDSSMLDDEKPSNSLGNAFGFTEGPKGF